MDQNTLLIILIIFVALGALGLLLLLASVTMRHRRLDAASDTE